MVPVVYSPAYDVTAFGLERLHPFDGRKYRRIRDWLVRQGLRRPPDFVAPTPSTDVPLALLTFRGEAGLRSAVVVDPDAHQGDGTADAIRPWPWARVLDLFERD